MSAMTKIRSGALGVLCFLVAVLGAPPASAAALAEGTYSFTFDGSKKATGGQPDPMRTTVVMAGLRSSCPATGCVATVLEVYGISQSILVSPPPNAWVYRQTNTQWEGTRPHDYDCNGTKVAGTETQTFKVNQNGSLSGVDTQVQAPCPTVVVPFTAKRTSPTLPVVQSGEAPADPNTV